MRLVTTILFSLLLGAAAEAQWWRIQTSGIDTNLRGVSVRSVKNAKVFPVPVVWASGSKGVILRSLDEGETWTRLNVSGGDALDFRGIVALSERIAYVMSSGEGEKSRIYKTADGGETWNLQYTDKRKEFFLDAIACLSEKHCYALGDPIDGKFLLLSTTDGGHWNPLPNETMPKALPAEGAFAASNSSLLLSGEEIFFGTGGPAARVFRSPDSGHTWSVAETPLAHGKASAGIFSIADDNRTDVVIAGGDYQDSKLASAVAAYSHDGGKTWQLSELQPAGYRSAVAALGKTFLAVGPTGEEVSEDHGTHWRQTGSLNLNAVAGLDAQNVWAVGPNGTIARFMASKN